jgi:hypothetical protein
MWVNTLIEPFVVDDVNQMNSQRRPRAGRLKENPVATFNQRPKTNLRLLGEQKQL